MNKRYLGFSTAVLLISLVIPARATVVTIDFDSITAAPAGTDATSYLSGFGITASQTYSGTVPLLGAYDDRYIYTGWDGTGADPALYLEAPSSHNVFTQVGNNGPITFSFQFASALSSFSFASVGIGSRPQSTSFPAWAAEAYDSSGGLLDSVFQNFQVNRATSVFTLSASDFLIDTITFYRDGTRGTASTNGTAYSNVVLDDLVLTQADVPEPSTLALLSLGLLGLFGLGFNRCKKLK